jgi:mannosyltransferase
VTVGVAGRASVTVRAAAEDERWIARISRMARTRQDLVCLVGLTVLAAGLRLWRITARDVWQDEIFAITAAQLPIPELLSTLVQLDPHPPLYYLLMHVWVALTGTDPLMIRLPSALLSSATIPLFYLTAVRLIGRPAALAAGVLLSCSALHVAWAQEARMYALLVLLCLGSTYLLLRALEDGRPVWWVLHSLVSVAALYAQYAAVFFLAAQAGAVLLYLIAGRRRTALAWWSASQVGVALLFLPWLPSFMAQSALHGDGLYSYANLVSVRGVLRQLTYGVFPYWRVPYGVEWLTRDGVVVAALLVAVYGAWSLRGRLAGWLVPSLFFGSVGLLILSGISRAIVNPKIVLPALLGYYLLLGVGLVATRRRGVVIAGIAAIALLNLIGIARAQLQLVEAGGGFREEWGEISARLQREYRVGDLVLADASPAVAPLRYHLDLHGAPPIEIHGVPFKTWAVSPPPLDETDFRRIDALLEDRCSVWMVWYRSGFPDEEGQLMPYLIGRYALAETLAVPRVRLYRFVSGTPCDPPTPSSR